MFFFFCVCISNLMKSTVVYVAIQFSPEIERKGSKEYLDILLAVKESFERFSCLGFIFEKSKHRDAGLEHKHKTQDFQRHFILVFLKENRCLSICFTELYFFYCLLVVARVILIAVPFVFSRSVNIACRSIQNAASIKSF